MKHLCLLLVVASVPAIARAEVLSCGPDEVTTSDDTYLRSLALDLLGHAPSASEYDDFDGSPEAVASLLDTYLASEESVTRLVRWHREAVWPNLESSRLMANNFRIGFVNVLNAAGESVRVYRVPARNARYRGNREQVCSGEPARFDASGNIITEDLGGGVRREGWVEVAPYWAPTTTVKVCAFDAQVLERLDGGASCGSQEGSRSVRCGCGPNLRTCATGQAEQEILRAMVVSVERQIANVLRRDRSYLELFNAATLQLNGPLTHFLRYMLDSGTFTRFRPSPVAEADLPALTFADVDRWQTVAMPSRSAGILTHPAYLMRFATNRARANRFYEAFLCAPLVPPEGGLPSADDTCSSEPDLQLRCGCKYCHAQLEPAAAAWGRWTQNGGGYLAATSFPKFDAACAACAANPSTCSDDCKTYYLVDPLTDAEEAYVGKLLPYVFRRPEHELAVERGPKQLVNTAIADGSLAEGAVRQAVSRLLHRDLGAGDQEWLDEMVSRFVASGYSYRALLEAVVTSERYRRRL
jgi:hypothetical protein